MQNVASLTFYIYTECYYMWRTLMFSYCINYIMIPIISRRRSRSSKLRNGPIRRMHLILERDPGKMFKTHYVTNNFDTPSYADDEFNLVPDFSRDGNTLTKGSVNCNTAPECPAFHESTWVLRITKPACYICDWVLANFTLIAPGHFPARGTLYFSIGTSE